MQGSVGRHKPVQGIHNLAGTEIIGFSLLTVPGMQKFP